MSENGVTIEQGESPKCGTCGGSMVYVIHDNDPHFGSSSEGYECPDCRGSTEKIWESDDAE